MACPEFECHYTEALQPWQGLVAKLTELRIVKLRFHRAYPQLVLRKKYYKTLNVTTDTSRRDGKEREKVVEEDDRYTGGGAAVLSFPYAVDAEMPSTVTPTSACACCRYKTHMRRRAGSRGKAWLWTQCQTQSYSILTR